MPPIIYMPNRQTCKWSTNRNCGALRKSYLDLGHLTPDGVLGLVRRLHCVRLAAVACAFSHCTPISFRSSLKVLLHVRLGRPLLRLPPCGDHVIAVCACLSDASLRTCPASLRLLVVTISCSGTASVLRMTSSLVIRSLHVIPSIPHRHRR